MKAKIRVTSNKLLDFYRQIWYYFKVVENRWSSVARSIKNIRSKGEKT